MRRSLPIIIAAAVLGLALFGLWLLPRPRSSPADNCAGSLAPVACRALMLSASRDLAPSPSVGGLRDLADAMPPDLSARPLAVGLAALESHWFATAYRLCGDAAEEEGVDRAPAYVCQGRAALRLGWPQRAVYLAQRALDLQDDAAAHVLAGEAFEVLREVKLSRVEYLRALDLEPENRAAIDGLRRVGGTPPTRLDMTGSLDEEEVSLA